MEIIPNNGIDILINISQRVLTPIIMVTLEKVYISQQREYQRQCQINQNEEKHEISFIQLSQRS